MLDKKQIRLEFDLNDTYICRGDKYGMILAYVYLMDGIFLNVGITKQGYGFAHTCFPFMCMEEFMRYEGGTGEARENKRALWRK